MVQDLNSRIIQLNCSTGYSNPYFAPGYWFSDQRPNQLSHSRAQLDWVSSLVRIVLINGSGYKFEDNSTELFNRVTVNNVSDIFKWQLTPTGIELTNTSDKSLSIPYLRN